MLASVLVLSLAPGLAMADDAKPADSTRLETITIKAEQAPRGSYNTATTNLGKQKQALKDVPQAVSVVTRQLIADQGDINMKDVLKNVSGISFAAGEGGRSGDQIYLRGFAAFADTYRDGQRDVAQYNRDPFNDEKIEVLKGASSMLFGRGSTGGVINQVSKTPFAGDQLEVTGTIGTDHFHRETADINQALSDTTAIRLNVMNTTDGTPNGIAEQKRYGVAPSIAFGLGEPTTIVLSHMHMTENNTTMLGVPFDPNTLQPIDVPVDRYYGLQGMNSEDITSDISTARITHKIDSNNEISSQLRVSRYDRWLTSAQPQLVGASAGTPVTDSTALRYSGKNRGSLNETQSLTTDYNGKFNTGNLRHNLLAGLEFTRETSDAFNIGSSSISGLTTTVGNPSAVSYRGNYTTSPANSFVTRNLAVYATDTVELNAHWKVMGGLRMDKLDGDYKAYTNGSVSRSITRSDKGMSYRTGLIWQPTDTSSYYAGYSSLMNPSGEAYQFDVTSGATDKQAPERNKHYEIGAKWELADGDATVRTALFRTVKYNERNTDALSPDVSILYAERHTDGFEVEVAGRLSEKWEVFAGAALMNPKIDHGWVNNASSDVNRGAVPKYTPKTTANIWTTYKVTDKITGGLGLYYVGKRYASDGNSDQSSTRFAAAYTRVDAMISYDMRPYTIKLNLNNLTNKKYYDAMYAGHASAAAPREAQLTVAYKY